MIRIERVLLLAITLCCGLSAHAQTVRTQSGDLHGASADGVTAFLGIPYAAPPIGPNRWRAPQPVAPWRGTRDALNYASDCAQSLFPLDSAPIRTVPSEDCLYLNIWTPAGARPGDGLPVMVWIHGGGFLIGGTSPAIYSGHNFARDGVVLVSLNYRLGRFGFFAHPALEREGFGGNFGFLDQIAALKWVQANIGSFGGDPGRVTVFGQSAGGASVLMLLQTPQARGLFHAAIIQSGGGRQRALPIKNMANAAKLGQAFAPGATAAELRALPTEKVTIKFDGPDADRSGFSGPMFDGRTILGLPVDAINAGLYANVPVMIGTNSADGLPSILDKDKVFAAFDEDQAKARTLYDPDGSDSALKVESRTSMDQFYAEPARAVARGLAERGQRVWLYRFAHNGATIGIAMGGAPHSSEIPYVFGTIAKMRDALGAPEDAFVASLMHRYWVNFAKFGRPEGERERPDWHTATAQDLSLQMIRSDGASHVVDPLVARLDFAEKRTKTPR